MELLRDGIPLQVQHEFQRLRLPDAAPQEEPVRTLFQHPGALLHLAQIIKGGHVPDGKGQGQLLCFPGGQLFRLGKGA